ncbi:MAG: hypothetical protein WCO56_17755 [Verrucomicrobiota bacterium]
MITRRTTTAIVMMVMRAGIVVVTTLRLLPTEQRRDLHDYKFLKSNIPATKPYTRRFMTHIRAA